MDLKSLYQKLDQIAESSDVKSISETKKKKPDADGDGVPDWADKKPGEDDNADKKKDVEESMDAPMSKAVHAGYLSREQGDKPPKMSAKEKAEAQAARDARDAADMKALFAKHDAKMKKGVAEGSGQNNPVVSAILNRIMNSHPELLAKHGPQSVMDAVDSVADFVGDVEEIGSSDVSGWVKNVISELDGINESVNFPVPTRQMTNDQIQELFYDFAKKYAAKKGITGKNDIMAIASLAMDTYMSSGESKEAAAKFARRIKGSSLDVNEGEMSTRIGDKGETIRKHTAKAGGYGRKIDKDDESGDAFHSSDIDDSDEVKKSEPTAKRGRGRPMKGGDSDTGIVKKYDTDTLASWIIGNKPKNIGNIGKVSVKHKLKDWMEHVERKQIVEGYVAEGKMNELSMIIDDIVNGQLDIYDIISGKYVPTNDLESFVKRVLTREYDNIAADRGLHADDDHEKIIEIMYNEIHEIMNKALAKDLDEAEQVTIEPAKTSTQVIKQGTKVLGQVTNPQLAATIKQAIGTGQMTLAGNPQMHESVSTDKSIINESTLDEIIGNYPHEHKMCQEGWGMDESLYSTLCDHYYKEGRIPRSVWHGSAEQLRDWVEECYFKDTQPLMGETRERDLRKDAMSNLVDELDEEFMTMDESEESIANQGIEAAHLDDNEVEVHPFKQTIDMDPIRGLETIRDFKQMNEAKKPSAGLSKAQKSKVVKKAKSGGDIGKAGKGFEKIAKDAAERYGSKEKGEKVAAAAMWKNVPRESVEEGKEEDWDAAALAAGKRGRDARDNPSLAVALRKKSQSSRDAAKELEKLRQSHRDVEESGQIDEISDETKKRYVNAAALDAARLGNTLGRAQMNKSKDTQKVVGDKITNRLTGIKRATDKMVDESVESDDKAEKAGKKVTKDLEYDMKHKGKDDNKAEKAGKKVTKDIEYDEKLNEKFGKEASVDPEKKGMFKGKTKAELQKQYNKLKASGPHKLGSAENTKMKELAFAIRAKSGWGEVQESSDFSQWDNQLSSLINVTEKPMVAESTQVKKQTVNEDVELSNLLKFAGFKDSENVMEELNASIYGEATESSEDSDSCETPTMPMPKGMGMSQNTEENPNSKVIEPMMNDEVISGLSDESEQSDDDHLSFFKKMLTHGEKVHEDNYDSTQQSGIPASTSQSPISGQTSNLPEEDEKEEKVEESIMDEAEMEEGNAFTGALAKAKADGIQPGETMKVGDKEYPVKEESVMTGNGDDEEEQSEVSSDAVRDAGLAQGDKDFFSSENSSTMAECDDQMDAASDPVIGDLLSKLAQIMGAQQPQVIDVEVEQPMDQDYAEEEPEHTSCQSCGEAMYEGHKCMESLNEWANSPEGQSADEQFQTDMEFMTKVISGGLNNQKQDQTTLPSTRVVTQDERKETDNTIGSMLRKLSGIN